MKTYSLYLGKTVLFHHRNKIRLGFVIGLGRDDKILVNVPGGVWVPHAETPGVNFECSLLPSTPDPTEFYWEPFREIPL